ncbi:hypothetical protein [Mahella sp.]|nr:hypothetical protein [Mahella sp.]MBZ4666475.1 hypothetical protein [Mahella sp.]
MTIYEKIDRYKMAIDEMRPFEDRRAAFFCFQTGVRRGPVFHKNLCQ